jgi:hypothetical protein
VSVSRSRTGGAGPYQGTSRAEGFTPGGATVSVGTPAPVLPQ